MSKDAPVDGTWSVPSFELLFYSYVHIVKYVDIFHTVFVAYYLMKYFKRYPLLIFSSPGGISARSKINVYNYNLPDYFVNCRLLL